MKYITLEDWEKELLKDAAVRAEIKKLEPEYQLARSMIAARIKKKLTQAQIAKRAKTDQATISRLETGDSKPSLSLLNKVAKALDAQLMITFKI